MKRSRSRQRSQSPLRIRSNGLVQLEALGKDVVANHDYHQRRRSEAPPGDVVHHSDMVVRRGRREKREARMAEHKQKEREEGWEKSGGEV